IPPTTRHSCGRSTSPRRPGRRPRSASRSSAEGREMKPKPAVSICAAIVVAALGVGLVSTSSAASGAPTIKVKGRQLVDGSGRIVQLRGVNRAVFESRCTYDDTGFNDGPVDQASVAAMKSWKINAVRVTLNEDCWLGVNDLPAGGNAAAYRKAVIAYISLLG